MYFSVKQVAPKPDYLLLLTFETGEKKAIRYETVFGYWHFQRIERHKII